MTEMLTYTTFRDTTDNLHDWGIFSVMYTSFWQIIRHRCVQLFFRSSKKPCNRTWLQGFERTGCARFVLASCLEPLVVRFVLGAALRPHARSAYTDGRGPLDTRMVIVAPGTALDGVWPTTLPVATLSS